VHSDEMSDGGEEFASIAVTAVGSDTDASSTAFSRAPTSKLNQIGNAAAAAIVHEDSNTEALEQT